ncbi:MAG: FAD-dependent oxidoreductase, partial [Acidobacteria bacterium]|nr:FAD-dependent oxidoreductase [Acidobacteriota bacterium]
MRIETDLLCLGSGPAGQKAAVQAAKLGKRAVIVEKRRIVGGVCLDTGTIPSKTFREAVLFYASLGGRFDRRKGPLRIEARPSAEDLLGRVHEVIAVESAIVEKQLARNDVLLVRGTASFLDPHTVVVRSPGGAEPHHSGGGDDQIVHAEKIVIAVGTTPAMPKGLSEDGEIVITSDGIMSLTKIPRSRAGGGAGVIGRGDAGIFSALGGGVAGS